MKTIGQAGYGYIDIPSNWQEFNEANSAPGIISYCRDSHTIVHMNLLSSDIDPQRAVEKLMLSQIDELSDENVSSGSMKIGGFLSYEVSSRYSDGTILKQWIFKDDIGKVHYLSFEAQKNDTNECLDIIKSYRLTKTVDTMRVGLDKYGYLSLPLNWVSFRDKDPAPGVIQFTDGNGAIISLNIIETEPYMEPQMALSALAEHHKGQGAKNIMGATVTLNGKTAYQLNGFYPYSNSFIVIWMFRGPGGKNNYICAEAPQDTIMNTVSIIENTFSFSYAVTGVKRVYKKTLGYLDIPNTWVEYMGELLLPALVSHGAESWTDNAGTVITVNSFFSNISAHDTLVMIAGFYKEKGAIDIQYSDIKLNDLLAHQIMGLNPNKKKFIAVRVFDDQNNFVRCISLEAAPATFIAALTLFDTFSPDNCVLK